MTHKHKHPPKRHWTVRLGIMLAAIVFSIVAVEHLKTASNLRLAGVVSIGPVMAKIVEVICDLICDRIFPEL